MLCFRNCGAKCRKVEQISEKGVRRMLMGIYEHALDAKGRLIIPAKLREELGDNFFITKNVDSCLAIYPENEWQKFKEKLDTLPKISSEAARRLRRFYFGNSQLLEADKQGRVLIPQTLRDFAGLTKDVTLVGVDDHVEIWDQESWNKYNEENNIDDILYDLGDIDL